MHLISVFVRSCIDSPLQVLVSRLGIPGQQIALTSAGVEYAVSQLQVPAVEGATARDERRRLDRVVADAVDVFSESR